MIERLGEEGEMVAPEDIVLKLNEITDLLNNIAFTIINYTQKTGPVNTFRPLDPDSDEMELENVG